MEKEQERREGGRGPGGYKRVALVSPSLDEDSSQFNTVPLAFSLFAGLYMPMIYQFLVGELPVYSGKDF